MAKKEREKGKRGEREVVKLLKEAGFEARRTAPLQAGETSGDPDVELDNKYRIEVKRRKNGFEQLYKWLKNTDFLFVRADRKDYIVLYCIDVSTDIFRIVFGS